MSKSMSISFAIIATVLMGATAVMISINLWVALLFAFATIGFMGFTFAMKARLRRKLQQQN